MTILHIYFNVVAVYLQYILQTSWNVHSVYTATILPYNVSLLHFGLGKHLGCQYEQKFTPVGSGFRRVSPLGVVVMLEANYMYCKTLYFRETQVFYSMK